MAGRSSHGKKANQSNQSNQPAHAARSPRAGPRGRGYPHGMTDPAPTPTPTAPTPANDSPVLPKYAWCDDLGKLILRVGFGATMLSHGIPKMLGFDGTAGFMDGLLGLPGQVNAALAIFAEVGCSILLIVGLLTRLATIPLAFTMGVALLVVHLNDGWEKQEKAALYLIAYLAIMCVGAGRFSVDHLVFGKKPR